MDSLCLKSGIHGIAPPIPINGSLEVRTNPSQVSAVGRNTAADRSPLRTVFSRFSFKYPLKSFWPGGGGGEGGNGKYNGLAVDDAVLVESGGKEGKAFDKEEEEVGRMCSGDQDESWVLKILHVRSLWKREEASSADGNGHEDGEDDDNEEEECEYCRVDDDEEEERSVQFDRDSFSKLLRRVSLTEARLYAKMSYLGNLAYSIPEIKPGNLLRHHGLRFVTSSLAKRELSIKSEKDNVSAVTPEVEGILKEGEERNEQNLGHQISASAAYQIVASAASYLHSHTMNILPFRSSKDAVSEDCLDGCCEFNTMNMEEVASLMATTDSVTAVVAAKEEVKQAVADDLKSQHSSPCEWFICDDDQSGTRYFVIQGSESLASWQANLLFEPIQFEGLDVLVHRGIYEAAKGIYEQMLPEVHEHLKSQGHQATFRFTGHSLGGSLALLVNLMLYIRNEAPSSSLLPVITFGSPSIMCGGDTLLRKLGLPRSHVQSITMHRDIVPRAFSCNYPMPVAKLLKAVNRNFQNHPCLNNQKLLYAPMGELLILQPDEKFSPNHDLLPPGSGLYLLSCPPTEANDVDRQLRDAQLVFLNSPHPLEILRDRSAYGSGGAIQRDHDMRSYMTSVRNVIRQELNQIRKAKREHRRKVWWPLVTLHPVGAGIVDRRPAVSINMNQNQFNFSGMLKTGSESLKRFKRLVASQHMHLSVVLLLQAQLLLLRVCCLVSFRQVV